MTNFFILVGLLILILVIVLISWLVCAKQPHVLGKPDPKCNECYGTGTAICPACEGTKDVVVNTVLFTTTKCGACRGRGEVICDCRRKQ